MIGIKNDFVLLWSFLFFGGAPNLSHLSDP
jgi:hypothetical protein